MKIRKLLVPLVPTVIMPFRKISRDVKLAAVNLHEQNILSLGQILDCVGFSESMFWRMLKLWRETGDVVQHHYGIPGRPRLLHFGDVNYLLRLVNHHPDWFLDELPDLLDNNRFISVHYTTIYRELARAGISRKKLKKIAEERNEMERADFIRRMAQ
jgi:transposase